MILVIAEKPNQAEDLAHAILKHESVRRASTYFSGLACDTGEHVTIVFCAGHLLELLMPEGYNPAWAIWRIEDLPLHPPNMQFKMRPRDEDALVLLKSMERFAHEAREIVNACDAGREGELIFNETSKFLHFGTTKLTTRMWIQDPTENGLRKAFFSRKSANATRLRLMRDVAMLRQQADWLYGCNMSRYVTLSVPQHPQFKVRRHAIGRVQTAVLGIIHDRSHEVTSFQAEPYYRIRLTMMGEQEAFLAYVVAEKEQQFGRVNTHFRDYEMARDIVQELHFNAHSWVAFDDSPEALEHPPEPFSLVELQRSCWRLLGWNSKYTLQVAQECYAKEKTLTYPRTESFHLPRSTMGDMHRLRQSLWEKHILAQFKDCEALPPFEMGDRYFKKDEEMEEHHAIIPTGRIPSRMDARGQVKHTYLLWDLVVRRFVMSLQKPAVSCQSTRILSYTSADKAGKEYRAIFKADVLKTASWLETEDIIGNTRGYGKTLADRRRESFPSCDHNAVPMLKSEVVKDYTKRPEEYNDDTLLGLMVKMSLGTAATRADIVDKLILRDYIERTPSGSLTPRIVGSHLVAELKRLGAGELLSPEVTSKWEKVFDEIEEGNREYHGPKEFLDALMAQIRAIGNRLHQRGAGEAAPQDDTVYCPETQKPMSQDKHFYYFDGFPKIAFPKNHVGRPMSGMEWRDVLVANPKVGAGPYEGFIKRNGERFNASVSFLRRPTKYGHFKFIFPK